MTPANADPATAAPAPLILRALDGIDAAIVIACKAIIVATGTVMLVVLAASVTSRYFFNFSLVWVGEVPEQLFPWMIAAGVALAAVTNSHIAVDLLMKVLPARWRRLLIVVVQLLVAATYATLVVFALDVATITALERSPVLRVPGSYGYWAFALGAAVVAFAAVSQLTRFLVTGREPVAGTLGQEHAQ